MKNIKRIALPLMLLPSIACADDVFGVYAGIGHWTQNVKGYVDYDGSDVELEDDLKLENDSGLTFYVAVEHFVPMLPNVKIQHSKVSTEGSHTLDEQIEFGGVTYAVDEDIISDFELNDTDLILYYEVLDNWANLDLGLDIKRLDGDVEIYSETTTQTSDKSFDVVIPMLYAKAQIDIPATGFYISGQGSAISYDGSGVTDLRVMAGYEFDYGLGFELGWRQFSVEIDDVDDLDADITVEGAYANLRYHF